MPKGQLKRAKRLKKGPKNPFLNLKNKKSVFRRVVKRLNTEKSKKITERGKGKNHGRLRLFAQPLTAAACAICRLPQRILCQYAFGQGKICDAICHPVTSRFIGGYRMTPPSHLSC
jgi:hypothetical protein